MYTGDERDTPSENMQSEYVFDPENPVYGRPGVEQQEVGELTGEELEE